MMLLRMYVLLSMMLLSVQFCAGVKVLRDWGVVAVNGDSTVSEVFHGVSSGQIESADGFHLPKQYADSPVSCSIAPTQTGKFQSIPVSIKVQNAVEFWKYLKFVLQCVSVLPTASKDAFVVLMKEAGRQMWLDKYDVTRKNNRQKLHNDIIECMREKKLGWSKENVLSAGNPFVMQLGDILAIPRLQSYKQKRPNLKRESVTTMSHTLFGILQQVGW